MNEVLSFEIEVVAQAYPAYPPIVTLKKNGSIYAKYHTTITFQDGTKLDNYSGDWIYDNKYFQSLEVLLEFLPEKVQEAILFNLDIFRNI